MRAFIIEFMVGEKLSPEVGRFFEAAKCDGSVSLFYDNEGMKGIRCAWMGKRYAAYRLEKTKSWMLWHTPQMAQLSQREIGLLDRLDTALNILERAYSETTNSEYLARVHRAVGLPLESEWAEQRAAA